MEFSIGKVQTVHEQTEQLKQYVVSVGFTSVGIAKATTLDDEYARMQEWLGRGYHGTMGYLARNDAQRHFLRLLFPCAESVILLTHTYFTKHNNTPLDEGSGKISRYAWGDDYHEIIPPKLRLVEEYLHSQFPEATTRQYVDTGPVMEKAWAVRAGIGWQGKHSNIISRTAGSYFFLSVIITTAVFEYDNPVADYCGTCTACLDACPTGAILQPYVVDSTRCIPYWTIETKPDIEIPLDISQNLDGWLFGCDVCQDVCPWNRFKQETAEPCFEPRNAETSLHLDGVLSMEQGQFSERFRKSPVKRTKLAGLQRNARALKSNG
ncbi:MAG: tRNA epoxyqueuosine(34) reductase QueG [Candidatus Kapabacteria bacterium]|nr:tRNA epoxyqueuosine(34) reductase QueG [Candidatus Kapabacteria bacterium]